MILHFHKLDRINDLFVLLRDIFKSRKCLLIIGLGAFMVFVFSLIGHKNKNITDSLSLQNKRAAVILHELEDIHSALYRIENNPLNSKQQQLALQDLEKNISLAQQYLAETAKVSDIQKVSNQIMLVKNDLDTGMNDLKKVISENSSSNSFLEASALPFRVVSVDVIAGEPYVSVEYANHVSPLTVGDLLAEWRVVSVDYELGIAEFVNTKNQHVRVNVQGE